MNAGDHISDITSLKNDVIKSKNVDPPEQFQVLSKTFPLIFQAVKATNVSNLYRTNACDALSIWFARSQQLVSKNPLFKDEFMNFFPEESADFTFHYVIDFWNDSGAALGNALKEMFTKMVGYLTSIFHEDESELIFKRWLSEALDLPYTMRALYFMVEHLHKRVRQVDYIFQVKPNFIVNCLENIWSKALSSIIGKAVFLVLRYCYSKDSESEWLSLWEDHLIELLEHDDLRKGIESYLLPNLFQLSKPATIRFLKRVISKNNTPVLISALKVAKDSAIVSEPFLEIDLKTNKPLLDIKELSVLLELTSASYRVGAFHLLVSSPKNSMPIPRVVYQTIMDSLDMVFTDSDLETRNEISAYLKKFITRIKESTYAAKRDATSLTKKNYSKFEDEIKEKLNNVEQAQLFLKLFLTFIENNLRPGASYLQKEMGCRLLLALIRSGLDSRVDPLSLDKSRNVNFAFSIEIYNPTLVRLVIDNILDDYDDIRQYSMEIITIAPFKLDQVVDMKLLESRAIQMLADIRGKNVDSGARFFRFAFEYYQRSQDLEKCSGIVRLLLHRIEFSLLRAKEQLADACIHNSIQGYFATFKFIFEIMNLNFCESILKNHNIVERLLNATTEIWYIVKVILQHDSPEGMLLDNFEESYTKEMEKTYGKGTQVLLSYSWRAIKESTNMIDILLKLKTSPLKNNQIIVLGALLREQLATIRHRGAFSSVYPTFVSCCSLCMRRKMSQIPEQWLRENLELIQQRSKYITRRSAGIPFLITAILSSNKGLIASTFQKLLDIANLPIEEEDAVVENINLPQVNAFNCIKVIFTDATLSEDSIGYVDQAFVLTLNSFASPFWAIRNCAVMLFSALQNRLFSSKKVKANYLSSYPARLFFEKFTSIHDIFLKTLKESVDSGLRKQKEIEKVFPILTVMSRLEPTPGYKGLDDFYPLIIEILKNNTWKVREMAARSLPSLIFDSEHFFATIEILLSEIFPGNNDFNKMHGCLLAVKETILKFETLSTEESNKTYKKLLVENNSTRQKILSKVNIVLGDHKCYPIKLAYFQILTVLDVNTSQDHQLQEILLEWFEVNSKVRSYDGAKHLTLKELTHILFPLLDDEAKSFIDTFLLSPYYEIQLSCIEYYNNRVKKLRNTTKAHLAKTIWKLIEAEDVWIFVKSQALKLLKSVEVSTSGSVDSIGNVRLHTSKLMNLLSGESNEEIKLSIIEALGPYVAKQLLFDKGDLENVKKWLKKVELMISDDLEYVVRMAALKSLTAFHQTYSSEGENAKIKFEVEGLLFSFLTDDDEKITQIAADHLVQYVLKIPGKQSILPVVVEKLMIEYFSHVKDAKLLSTIVDPRYFRFYDIDTKLDDILKSDSLLFSIEKNNLERNPVNKVNELVTLFDNLHFASVDFSLLKKTLLRNLSDIYEYLSQKDLKDGCFGVLSNDKVFDFISCQLLLLRSLKQHNLIDYNASKIAKLLLLNDKQFHPLISKIL